MTLIAISGIIALLYVIINIITSKKVPESISAMVYDLPKDKQWIWILYMWTIAFTVSPHIIELLDENFKVLGFLMMASLAFCGAMPLVEDSKNIAHNVFGISAGILSQICVALINPKWLLVWIVMIVFIVPKLNKILSENTGRDLEEIEKDTERDYYLDANEALEYGIIDKIL